MPLKHTTACRNKWSAEIQLCTCGMQKANRALAAKNAEIARLRREKQDAFDMGFRAAGGTITPLKATT